MTKLTTHVLNTMTGLPASGLVCKLYSLQGGESFIKEACTNDDGRVDTPLLEGTAFNAGAYRIVFYAGEYLKDKGGSDFLDTIPIDFRITDTQRHHHVPLLLSAYGYSTYRGS